MKTLILTEKQVSSIIDKIINEQQASEFAGSTDANTISHALLSKNFGLPNGAKNENFYYGAKIEDVINMSADSSKRSQFLSVFKPINSYSDNVKDFYDYIEVNGNKLDDRGTKNFQFISGKVYAAHNGLLALVRAMDRMKGNGGTLTITFGRSKSGKQAEGERKSEGISFNSDRALNLTAAMNLLQNILCSISIKPKLIEMTTSMAQGKSTQEMINMIPTIIYNIITGVYGFMDSSRKDEIIKNLTPKGFVTTIDFDSSSLISILQKLQSISDMKMDYNTGKLTEYNEEKRNQLNSISKSLHNDMINKLKSAYMNNFKIYVENYLPNSKDQIIPLIPKVKFETAYLGETHYRLFHSKFAGSVTTSSTLQAAAGNYKTGN